MLCNNKDKTRCATPSFIHLPFPCPLGMRNFTATGIEADIFNCILRPQVYCRPRVNQSRQLLALCSSSIPGCVNQTVRVYSVALRQTDTEGQINRTTVTWRAERIDLKRRTILASFAVQRLVKVTNQTRNTIRR
jgi:hypothetical protein